MLQPSDLRKFNEATPENPVFLTGSVGKWDYYGEGTELAYSGVTAVTGRADSEDHHGNPEYRISVLRVDERGLDPNGEESRWRAGDFAVKSSEELWDATVSPKTPEMDRLYNDFQDMHDNTPYQASGQLYSESPSYRSWDKEHKYPEYEPIEGTKQTWDLSKETLKDGSFIKSLEDAERWVLENHPAYYIGMSAHQDCPSGDVMFGAVPSAYPEGYRETYENRMKYAQESADRLGVQLGTENAHDVLRDYHAQKADEQREQNSAQPRNERRLPDISWISDGADMSGPEY